MRSQRRSPLALLSNPVCYRIVATVGRHGRQTTEALAKALSDVPVSTLYRRLAQLREARIMRVVAERPARGAVERTYALASREAAALQPEEVVSAPLSRLRATIRNFIAEMAAEVAAHIEAPSFSRSRKRFHAALYSAQLSDVEYLRALRDIGEAIRGARERSRGAQGVKSHNFYLVAKPDDAG